MNYKISYFQLKKKINYFGELAKDSLGISHSPFPCEEPGFAYLGLRWWLGLPW